MKKIIYLAIIISAVSLWSCKCSKKAQKTDNSTTQVTPFNEGTTATDNKCRLVVSFISRGDGTDSGLRSNFDDYISKFEKEKNKKMIADIYHWGREGEMDYCMDLKQFTADEQNEFVKGAKEIFGTSERVIVQENAVCAHKK
jgi:hypothetical protein